MAFIQGWFNEAVEAIFGHVPTREEKMAETQQKLQTIMDKADDDLCDLEIALEDCQAARRRAAAKGDTAALQRAARKTVRSERERARLELRKESIAQQLQQTREAEGDQVMLEARMQMITLVNQGMPLPTQQQLMPALYQYSANQERAKLVNETIRDALDDAQGSLASDTELDSAGEERVEELVEQQRAIETQKKFDRLPKPLGVPVNTSALKTETTSAKMLENREAARQLDAFLSEHTH